MAHWRLGFGLACNVLSPVDLMCDVAKPTSELGRTGVKLSMTRGLVGGTADCGLGLGVVCNAFRPVDTACDKAMLTAKLVMSQVESVVIVG